MAWLRLPINHVHGVDPANGQKIVLVFKDHSYQCLQYITISYLPKSSTIPYTLTMPCTIPTSVTYNKDYSLPTSNTIPTIAIPSIGNTLRTIIGGTHTHIDIFITTLCTVEK